MRSSVSRTIGCALFSLIPIASAHAVDQDISLSATVASSCTLSGSAAPSALSATIPVTNGQVSTTPITIDVPIACNAGASLIIGTLNGGLLRPGGAWPQTSNRIDYVAHVAGASYMPFSMDTEPTQGQTFFENPAAPSGPPNGNLTITITPKQPALPLYQGTYSDTLRVTVTPSQ